MHSSTHKRRWGTAPTNQNHNDPPLLTLDRESGAALSRAGLVGKAARIFPLVFCLHVLNAQKHQLISHAEEGSVHHKTFAILVPLHAGWGVGILLQPALESDHLSNSDRLVREGSSNVGLLRGEDTIFIHTVLPVVRFLMYNLVSSSNTLLIAFALRTRPKN